SKEDCHISETAYKKQTGSEEVEVQLFYEKDIDDDHMYDRRKGYDDDEWEPSDILLDEPSDMDTEIYDENKQLEADVPLISADLLANTTLDVSDECVKDKKKRKNLSAQGSAKRTTDENTMLKIEVVNLKKELNLHKQKTDQRFQPLEKILRFVLGIDISKFDYAFNEHTKYARKIVRRLGMAENPDLFLSNQQYMKELEDSMKKRDNSLSDETTLSSQLHVVKKSLRQLKQDEKRKRVMQQQRRDLKLLVELRDNPPKFVDDESKSVDEQLKSPSDLTSESNERTMNEKENMTGTVSNETLEDANNLNKG
ncbi:unnamed protein product, partial [Didymodactylos carnosus]